MFGASAGSALRTSKLMGMAPRYMCGSMRNFTYDDAPDRVKPGVALYPTNRRQRHARVNSNDT
jgi:hypothetical protein